MHDVAVTLRRRFYSLQKGPRKAHIRPGLSNGTQANKGVSYLIIVTYQCLTSLSRARLVSFDGSFRVSFASSFASNFI